MKQEGKAKVSELKTIAGVSSKTIYWRWSVEKLLAHLVGEVMRQSV